MTRTLPLMLFVVLLCSAMSHAWSMETEVVPLHYANANEVLPTLQGVLGKQGGISVYQNKLIIHADKTQIEVLKQLIKQLDTRPRNLLITVKRVLGGMHESRAGSSKVEITAGDRTSVSVNASAKSTVHSTHGDGISKVSALEGRPAFVTTGTRVQLPVTGTDSYGHLVPNTEYQDVSSGFYATAHVHSDLVTIRISDQREKLKGADIEHSSVGTMVSGKLGEWILVSGVDESHSGGGNSGSRHYSTQNSSAESVYLKVEVVKESE